jgi:type IV pilus assembly protein PilY1
VAFNSTSLGTDSVVYFARFQSSTWSGEMFAHALDPFSGAIASNPTWNSADALDAQSPSARQIVTLNDTTGTGVPFRTLASLSTKQQNDLNMGPSGADGKGQDRIDYLRGDRSDEATGNNFRVRDSALGDIIQSNPVYVGKPQGNYSAAFPDPGYDSFKSSNSGRHGIIYVGANDGMLHGFDEDTGEELIAYVPNSLFSNAATSGLHYLTDPAYIHRYYVDLSPAVADVYIGGVWKTMLVGGLRGGGKGLFALDVTDPSALTEANAANIVKWEFTTANDPDLGYTYSKPTIARLNNGKWAAIVGNGYNNTGDGKAHLFLIYMDGSGYVDIIAGSNGTVADPNGLSAPGVVDEDGDGIADIAYAGDLYGSLHRFDLSSFSSSVLFTGSRPITSKPVAARHPTETGNNTAPNILVFFGTGEYLTDPDKTSTATQSFYGVWDGGSNSAISESDSNAWLVQTYTTNGNYRIMTDNAITYGTQNSKHKGWRIDFTGGERVIADPLVRGDFVVFATMKPDSAVCSYGGSGWIMGVKLVNGGQPGDPLWDINDDGVFNDDDLVDGDSPSGIIIDKGMPNQPKVLSDLVYVTDTSGDAPDKPIKGDFYDGPGTGRLSWREIGTGN